MSAYTAPVGCPACRDSASGHCAQHPPTAVHPSQPGDFELAVAESEPPARKHGPLADAEPPPERVWVRPGASAGRVARRSRPSKSWRRHLRKTKALARAGRSGS